MRNADRKWNRSSALSPEEMAIFTEAMTATVSASMQRLALTLTPEQCKAVADDVAGTAHDLIEQRLFPEKFNYERRAHV